MFVLRNETIHRQRVAAGVHHNRAFFLSKVEYKQGAGGKNPSRILCHRYRCIAVYGVEMTEGGEVDAVETQVLEAVRDSCEVDWSSGGDCSL